MVLSPTNSTEPNALVDRPIRVAHRSRSLARHRRISSSSTTSFAINSALKRRTGAMIQPWARKKSADRATLPVQLRTSFTIRTLPRRTVHLLMEQPGEWKAQAQRQTRSDSDRDKGWFIDPCFRKILLPVGSLKKGANVLEFSASFHQELNPEAIYLLGTFGVLRGWTRKRPYIDRLPKTLKIGDVCSQGLPFYTGRIRYSIPLSSPVHPRSSTLLWRSRGVHPTLLAGNR